MDFTYSSKKRLPVLLHITAWIILFILPVFIFYTESNHATNFLYRVVVRTFLYLVLFYVNYFWLIPALLFKGQKLRYAITLVLIVIGLFVFGEKASDIFFPKRLYDQQFETELAKIFQQNKRPFPSETMHLYNYFITSFLVVSFSLGLRFSNRYIETEKRRKELEQERLNSELAFLKNQISPHFFFNTLNNIYSLVQINTDDAGKSILKLSKLMRYMLYESEQGNTMLSREIEFMHNYVDLMKLRLTDKVKLAVTFPEKYTDVSIPPLLFIPFIENAFKHGVSYREPSFITVLLDVTDHAILFTCCNSLGNRKEEGKDPASGIGLENVKKRLSLLFPEKHELTITRTESVYEVILKIDTTLNKTA